MAIRPRPHPTPSALHTALPILLALLAPLACSDETGAPGPPAPVSLGLEPQVRIGSLEGADALSRIADVEVGPDGEVYVLLPQEQRVVVFAPAGGEPLRSFGKEGEGPGELSFPSTLGFLADTLWIQDPRNRRVSFYSSTGVHLDDRPYPDLPAIGEGISLSVAGPLPGGRLMVSSSPGFRSELDGTDHPFPLMVFDRATGTLDTLATRNVAHGRSILVSGSGGEVQSVQIFQPVFSDVTLWARTPDDGGVVLVDRTVATRTDSATYRVTRVDIAGDTLFTTAVPYEPITVDPARVDSIVTRYARSGTPRDRIEEVLFLPDLHPPATDVLVGTDGRIWVAREDVEGEPRRWDVFDGTGTLVAHAEIPTGMDLYAADASGVWGVTTDELDVPYVVRLRIVEEGARNVGVEG